MALWLQKTYNDFDTGAKRTSSDRKKIVCLVMFKILLKPSALDWCFPSSWTP